jgi:hypothetical protein
MGLESVLGVNLAAAARWIIALIFVLALVFAALWAWRRFGPGGGMRPSSRGKQPRLGIVDVSNVDGTRKLVIVRRDDVEHLVMIGGPNDLVVESGIRKAEAAMVAAPAPAPAYVPQPAPQPAPVPQPAFSTRVPPPSAAPQPAPQPQVIPRVADPAPTVPVAPAPRPVAANTDQDALDAEMRRMMERMPVAPRS